MNLLPISKNKTKDLTKPFFILDRTYHISTSNDVDTTNYKKDLETIIKKSSDNTIMCYTEY